MMRALWTAGSGMKAQKMNIDVISNNLANVNTTGCKESRVDFRGSIIPDNPCCRDAYYPGSTNSHWHPNRTRRAACCYSKTLYSRRLQTNRCSI